MKDVQKSVFEMSFEEFAKYQEQERERLNLCKECFGSGRILEGGMFSSSFMCEKCNGSGKKI